MLKRVYNQSFLWTIIVYPTNQDFRGNGFK